MGEPSPAERPPYRSAILAGLHLGTLACLAVAQPVLDLLGRTPEFFVIRGSLPVDLVALALGLVVFPLLVLVPMGTAAERIGGRVGGVANSLLFAPLATILLLRVVKASGLDGWWPLALAAGIALALLYRRSKALRLFLTYLTPVLLVVPALFLFDPEIRRIVGRGGQEIEVYRTGARTPVLFLIFDEWSRSSILDGDGELDRQRLPNLAAFADSATWYRQGLAASDATELAVPSILTGRLAQPGRLPTSRDYPRSLFTLLGDYRIQALEPITRLCPPELNRYGVEQPGFRERFARLLTDSAVAWLHLVIPAPHDGRLPPVSDRWFGFVDPGEGAPAVAAPPPLAAIEGSEGDLMTVAQRALASGSRERDFRRFVAAIEPRPRAALYFGHFLLPHVPYEYLPSGRRYLTPGGRLPGLYATRWLDDPWPVDQALHRYLLQVGFLDRLLGELFDRLRAIDLFDRSLIVLMADHGSSFRAGKPRRLYDPEIAADLAAIPLFIKAPGQRQGRVVGEPISALAVLPLVLDQLGVEPPAESTSAGTEEPANDAGVFPFLSKYVGSVELEPESIESQVLAEARRGEALLDDDPLRWVPAGPRDDLIGRRVAELSELPAAKLKAIVDGENLYRTVDPDASVSLAWFSGWLTNGDQACCPTLAVALGGEIVATTRAHPGAGGGVQFSTLLPEGALEAGDNRLQVLEVVSRSDASTALRPLLAGAVDEVRLRAGAAGGVELVIGDDVQPVAEGIRGAIQIVEANRETVTVIGWAADVEAIAPAGELLIFHRERLVYRGSSSTPHLGVVERLGDERYLGSGFEVILPRAEVPELEAHGVRVFARSRTGGVGEVPAEYQRLETSADGSERVVVSDGRRVELGVGPLTGRLQQLEERGGRLWVAGWAVDTERAQPAERVVLFRNGRRLRQLRPGGERPAIAERYGSGALSSGFNVPLELEDREPLLAGELRFVAVSHAGAAEIEIPRRFYQ